MKYNLVISSGDKGQNFSSSVYICKACLSKINILANLGCQLDWIGKCLD
jgi:hypothetical protein